jgi:hypothetical protein
MWSTRFRNWVSPKLACLKSEYRFIINPIVDYALQFETRQFRPADRGGDSRLTLRLTLGCLQAKELGLVLRRVGSGCGFRDKVNGIPG